MRPTFLHQGFLVILLASLLLGATELLVVGVSSLFPSDQSSDSEVSGIPSAKQDSLGESAPSETVDTIAAEPTAPSHPLARFYQALIQLRKQPTHKQVRVAYFGDSMIEGDLVTQSLRHDLQAMFGGSGVGFVPATSPLWGFRKTVRHRFDEGQWRSYSVLGTKPNDCEFGISGEVFLPRGSRPWLSFAGTNEYPSTEQLQEVKLFYGPTGESQPYCLVETDMQQDTTWLKGQALVNEEVISDSCGEDLNLRLVSANKLPIYGLTMGSSFGIAIDNFAMRSSTGTQLSKISQASLSLFHEYLRYDLVVLQFGLNLVSADRENFSTYEKALKEVVAHIQQSMPGVDILIVSVGDKCSRVNGVWQTDPSIPRIIDTQRKVAEESGVGFLPLFDLMGGRNSMVEWVNSRPSLARSDYAHPNRLGAERVSQLIRDELLDGFEAFSGESLRQGVAGIIRP